VVGGRGFVTLAALACGLALAPCSAASAAPADLDTSFGSGGIAAVEAPSGGGFPVESAARMAIGPRDEIFVLYSSYTGCESPFECNIELTVARYSADGRHDPSFDAGGAPQLVVRQSPFSHKFDIAVGPDGKPVVAAFSDPEDALTVARLDTEGHLDPTFGAGGETRHLSTHTIEVVRTAPVVAVQADGKILVAGEGDRGPDSSQLILARYLPNGEFDPSFGSGGEAVLTLGTQSVPAGVLLGSGGSVYVPAPRCCGGSGPLFGGGFSVARFLSNGQPDPGWAGGGTLFFPTTGAEGAVEAAAPAPDGGIFVVFEESTPTVSTVGNVVELGPDGTPDRNFGRGGRIRLYPRIGNTDPTGIAVDRQGRIVGVGWEGQVSLFRLRPDGSADRTFNGGQNLLVPYGGDASTPYLVGVQSSGRIVALGESGSCCGGSKGFALIGLLGGTDHTRCMGHRATIVGTRGPNEIVGTPHRDVIAALGGRDTVRGLGGDDLICGGRGRDKLFGGAGRDVVKQ
jgi:uncharacterized delta-60 repeat protein